MVQPKDTNRPSMMVIFVMPAAQEIETGGSNLRLTPSGSAKP
jgi:hypothetical protein